MKFADEQRALTDPDVLAAVTALAETYRTLVSGIYYEKPPERRSRPRSTPPWPNSFRSTRSKPRPRRFAALKDSAIFAVLVYLARLCRSFHQRPPALAPVPASCCAPELPRRRNSPPEASRIITP